MSNEEKKEVLEKIDSLENGTDKKVRIRKRAMQYFWITIGVILMDIGYYFFFDPAGIVCGGVTGIAIILKPFWEGTWFKSSYFLYALEVICLFLGLVFIGKDFFIKTIYASILSPTVIFLFELFISPLAFYETISQGNEAIICLVMGALTSGIGVGLALRNNGSTGGMDVIQKIISKYAKIPLSQTMYFTDWVIVIIAGFSFIPEFGFHIESVVYGSIGVITMSYMIDYLALSAKSRRTVYVIGDDPQRIKELIYSELNRGVTFCPVTGAYTNQERTMVICTMDKNEAYRIVSRIQEVDPDAFTFVTSCKEVRGEYDKRGLI